jgi:deoxyadenosine/deoxycytidine kinase
MSNKLVAFIGVPGSGKTTAAKVLEKSGFNLSEEDYANNSFLSKYYEEMPRWAFHSQMYFLINKIKQYEEINKSLKNSHVVQDFPLYQDVAYARTTHKLGNMSKEEWELYHDAFTLFDKKFKQPDLLIYLKVTPSTAISRIRTRGRDFESSIDESYLSSLQESIEELVSNNKSKTKSLILEADKINLVSNQVDINELSHQVNKLISEQ